MTLRHATTRCVMGSTGALDYPGGWRDRDVLDVQVQGSDPTVQLGAPASQAQAPFAMGAMDDCFRLGTGLAL